MVENVSDPTLAEFLTINLRDDTVAVLRAELEEHRGLTASEKPLELVHQI
jgi:hypothetical protein